jgi:hypothetical protein
MPPSSSSSALTNGNDCCCCCTSCCCCCSCCPAASAARLALSIASICSRACCSSSSSRCLPAPPPPRPPPPPPLPPPPPPPPAAECQSCEIVLRGNNNLGLQGTTALADGGRTGYCYRYPDEPQVIHYSFGSGLEPGMVCYMESTASSAYEWELVAACRCDTIISDDALVGSSQTGPAF